MGQNISIYKSNNFIHKISVIIPVYNVAPYLKQCLDSISNQTLTDFEAICINDGSTDSSTEILKDYSRRDERFRIVSQPNLGAGIARNNALNIAGGEYIIFIDPDDWMEKNAFEIIYTKMKSVNANILQFDYKIVDEISKKVRYKYFYKFAGKYRSNYQAHYNVNTFEQELFKKIGYSVWNKAYSKNFIQKYNIKFSPERHGEDHIFTIKSLILTTDVYYINKCLYNYRIRKGSALNSASEQKFCVVNNIEQVKSFLIEENIYNKSKNEFNKYKISTLASYCRGIPVDNLQKYFNLCSEYLTDKEYKQFRKIVQRGEKNFFEKIFSLKNNKINGQKYKMITVLGLSFNINKPETGVYS